MSFDAKVINVMIASPGDVQRERQAIRETIHTWNDVHAADRRCVLLPVGWETHSAPALGDRPQKLINDRVLEHCDLLVGVFWTRLGTPTGEAASGTVEEIRRHMAAGKPVMVYFSQQPVAPDSLDRSQYDALQDFKAWCAEQGLIHSYDTQDEFRVAFARHLQLTLRDDPYLKNLQRAVAGFSISDLPGLPDEDEHQISEEAKTLLKAGINDNQGVVMVGHFLNGDLIQTNGINFAEGCDARGRAAWKSAVDQLESKFFIEDRSGKGQVYFITDAGYRYAEKLRADQQDRPA
ncbi:DUF4062 domain-containing protein [Altererythrobacter aurantiacus]|uniref:DUF4062 domain-containing protein n=1 Tax=Parapontixanthobacter aurantiacus TaxID=1463599 RepID=A0A844ZHP7_9SPHN|nr:DUF4062 domain-containing protein [Parapontixanthobacter aurantiacus]MXO85249.1 DUF4062 domain-containing protein [Parapontixanthobacter aurantiacus]